MWHERLTTQQHRAVEAAITAYRNNRLTDAKLVDKLLANGVFEHEADEILDHERLISTL